MYKVIKDFADLQDKEHIYRTGDSFPRSGVEVSEDRIKELAGYANKRGVPLIEQVVASKASIEEPIEPPSDMPFADDTSKPRRGRKKNAN